MLHPQLILRILNRNIVPEYCTMRGKEVTLLFQMNDLRVQCRATKTCDDHNMFQRMDTIYRLTDYLTTEDFSLLMNSWDNELMQYMLHSKVHISKFMIRLIEWSPTIGIWFSRQWLLHRVRRWMLGQGSPNPRNMIRDCLKMNIVDPRTSTYGTICAQIMVCDLEVKKSSKDAPALRPSAPSRHDIIGRG